MSYVIIYMYYTYISIPFCQYATPKYFRAPAGCLQYFTGVAGTIKSFNWGDGTGTCSAGCMTQSQDYYACVRKESGIYTYSIIYISSSNHLKYFSPSK